MEQLNERQAKFCEVYVANGGNGAEAAREAGYKGPNVRITAHQLLKKPHIQAAVNEQLREQMALHGPVALKRIKELMGSDNPSVALKAAMDFADRAGLKPTEKKELTITDERTDEELQAAIDAHLAEIRATH